MTDITLVLISREIENIKQDIISERQITDISYTYIHIHLATCLSVLLLRINTFNIHICINII